MSLERYGGNPVLEPVRDHSWESRMVFNCAAVYEAGKIHIVYRAMGKHRISRLGYASTSDGLHIDERLGHPVFAPEEDSEYRGCEDPRITRIGRNYYMCYTAYGKVPQIAITSISVKDFLEHRWSWGDRILAFPRVSNKDCILFPQKIDGKYVMYHRIEPHIWVAYSYDLRHWFGSRIVMSPREGEWDCEKVGASAPLIKTNEGWLLIYHGVDKRWTYRLGVALVDLQDPEKILYRSEGPILEPATDYELYGEVPAVVFTCGAVVLDGKLFVYYGGADTVIGVATSEVSRLLP